MHCTVGGLSCKVGRGVLFFVRGMIQESKRYIHDAETSMSLVYR